MKIINQEMKIKFKMIQAHIHQKLQHLKKEDQNLN